MLNLITIVMREAWSFSPGFIDAHNHSDRGFTTDPSAASQVSQGITTVVIGQDGGSPFPVGEYLGHLDEILSH